MAENAMGVEHSIGDDTLVMLGGEVKSLGNGKVEGFGVLHTTHADPDLTRDFFDSSSDYGIHKSTPIFYDHGTDKTIKGRQIGVADIDIREAGVWFAGQLELADEYDRMIRELLDSNKLGFSTGTASHLVERTPVGKSYHIDRWPLGLDLSLTVRPAEPRTKAVSLKSLMDIKARGLSFGNKTEILQRAIIDKIGMPCDKYLWVSDVYDATVVWTVDEKSYEASYTIADDTVKIGNPVEVYRLVTYKPVASGLPKSQIPTERDFDRFLRDAGFSRKDATSITLHGFKTLLRDAGEPSAHLQQQAQIDKDCARLEAALAAL